MYFGVDIGGTTTRIGLFPTLDSSEFAPIARFPTFPNYDAQIQAIFSAIREVVDYPFAGIGVSLGGQLTKDGRSVQEAPNLASYVGRPFAQDLEALFACPVRLAHDTVCGLLGEKRFGALRQEERCAFLTLSTGTGVAIHLASGSRVLFVSIEFGHQLLDHNPLPCLCGQVGCLETHTGGRQLELRLGYSTEQITDRAFWEAFCQKLSWGLVNLAQLTRVEAIALSGSIALHNPFLLPLIQQGVAEKLRPATRLVLYPAGLAENSPLVGAASLLTLSEDAVVH
jgi:glucokinase